MQEHNHSQYRLQTWLTTQAGGDFSPDAAKYAADHVDVDWNQQAIDIARNYINILGLSSVQTYDQMTSQRGERIPEDMARRALDEIGQ